VIALLLVAVLGFAQTQAATGTISGVVRLGDSNAPLTGAVVHYNRLDTGNDPSVPDLNRKPSLVKTTENGRFSFSDLPAGRYQLWIEDPPGFVWMDRQQYSSGLSVVLGPAQHIDDIVFRFAPRGVINGRVLSANGEPLVGATVELVCVTYSEGNRMMSGNCGGQAVADTQGNYRIFWIVPGKYYVRTEYRPTAGVTDTYIYYPGTLDDSKATAVDVKPGSELTGIDFSLVAPPSTPGYTISGKVVGLPAVVANKPIEFLHLLRHEETSSELDSQYSNVAGDISGGQFQIRGVRSGIYELWTQVRDDSGQVYTARARVEVAGASVDDVAVAILPVVDLHVRIFVDGKPLETRPGQNARPPQLVPTDGTPNYVSFQYEPKGRQFNPNPGEFMFFRVPQGRYRIRYFTELPNGYVVDVRLGNQSVSDGFAIGEDTPRLVEVFGSSLGATIEGVVTGADLNPAFAATVAIASVPDPGKQAVWTVGLKTDKDGHFSMRSFSPGQYRVYAWMNPPAGTPWMNPDFMSRYELLGQTIVVTAGSTTTVRIIAIPEDK